MYKKALEHLFNVESEQWLRGYEHNVYLQKTGFLNGLRKAASLPDELILALDSQKEIIRERERPLSTFVSTPWHRPN